MSVDAPPDKNVPNKKAMKKLKKIQDKIAKLKKVLGKK